MNNLLISFSATFFIITNVDFESYASDKILHATNKNPEEVYSKLEREEKVFFHRLTQNPMKVNPEKC